MPSKERMPLNPGATGTVPQLPPRSTEHPLFKAGAALLVLANIATAVFAFLAGQKVGSEHVDFAIAFTFLGLVVVGIFGLAFIDNATRTQHDDWEYHH